MLNSSFYTLLIQKCSPAIILDVWIVGGWGVSCLIERQFWLYNTTKATQNIFGVEYKSWSSSLWNSGQPPVTSSFFGWNTFFSTLFFNMMWDYGQNDSRHSPNLIFCFSSWIQFQFVSVGPKYLNFTSFSKDILNIFMFWLCIMLRSHEFVKY